MLRCQCPSVCPSVRLSVQEVHWRIIANLCFKFRPNLPRIVVAVHAGALWLRCMPGRGERSSRTMLATARPSCNNYQELNTNWWQCILGYSTTSRRFCANLLKIYEWKLHHIRRAYKWWKCWCKNIGYKIHDSGYKNNDKTLLRWTFIGIVLQHFSLTYMPLCVDI